MKLNQFKTQLSYVGIIYLIFIKASYPPVCYSNYRVSEIRSPRFSLFLWSYSILSPVFLFELRNMLKIGSICL